MLLSSDVLSQRNVLAQSDIEKLIQQGKKLYENGEYEKAKDKFLEALTRARTKSELSDVYFNLSLAYFANDQNEKAIESLRKLFEIQPERTIDDWYCPPDFVNIFNQTKKEFAKPEEKRPVAKTKPAPERKVKKSGGGLFIIIGLLAAGGGAAALLLSKKGGAGGTEGPTTGSIQVNSTPTGASIYLDGSDTGYTTNYALTNVSPGSHTIKLIKEGYEDYEKSVSVSAGQTSSVDATLTKHTITVTSPTSSTIWTKGNDVEIKWELSESASFAGNVSTSYGLNPLSPGGDVFPSFQRRRAFQYKRSFQDVKRAGRRLESMGSSEGRELNLNRLSKFQDISGRSSTTTISSSSKDINSIRQIAKDIGLIKRNTRFGRDIFLGDARISLKKITSLGDMKVLTITNVKIDLYKGGNQVKTIISSTENDGSYTWTEVDASLTDGSDYKVRISCASDSEIYSESDAFKITHGYEFVLMWGSEGTIDGKFSSPRGLAVDSLGCVYVTDSGNSRIQKFTSDGAFVTKWGSYGSGDGQFNGPWGISIDSSDFIYVTDTNNHRIQKLTSDGAFVTNWGSQGSGDSQFDWPIGIAADRTGYVYVVDSKNHRIQKFTSDGTFVTKWGSEGSGDGQFKYPNEIAVDESDFVYVTDHANNRIQKFTSDGTFVTKWGGYGNWDGQFSGPHGIAVDSYVYVYVVDYWNSRIQKFTSDGTFVTKWGSKGSGDGQFNGPRGITIDSSGYVYVADTDNNRIQKFGPASAAPKKAGQMFNVVKSPLLNKFKARQKLSNTKR